MYMQNVLSQIENQINNEIRYTLHFRNLATQQITVMEYTHLIFQDEVKQMAASEGGGAHASAGVSSSNS